MYIILKLIKHYENYLEKQGDVKIMVLFILVYSILNILFGTFLYIILHKENNVFDLLDFHVCIPLCFCHVLYISLEY